MGDARLSQLSVSAAVAGTDARLSQLSVAAAAKSGSDVRLSQLAVMAAVNFPAEQGNLSQLSVNGAVTSEMSARVSQMFVLAAVRGRIEDPRVRAWTYSMDGHDFYVLRLGEIETLVYDTFSEQWYNWATADTVLWRLNHGHNWLGASQLADNYGSNVIVGHDNSGTLFFLNPTIDYDEPILDTDDFTYFERRVSGQVPHRGYSKVPCFGIELFGSIGESYVSSPFDTVTLEYSDDSGVSYTDAGTLSVPTGEYDTRLYWRALGSIKNPGRIFRVTDTGALRRIDAMEMPE